MSLSLARAESIAHYMEQIAPSEAGAITSLTNPDIHATMIVWNLLPKDVSEFYCLVNADNRGLVSQYYLKDDEDSHSFGDPTRVASYIHTDDEIARKIIVYGAQLLDDFRASALRNQALELARTTAHYRDLILEGLNAWGAGSSRRYVGASPKLAQARGFAPTQSPQPTLVSPDLQHVRELKSRAGLWIFANFAMITVAFGVSFVTYQDAAAGERYYLWWGPVVWGVINLFRLDSRMSNLSKIERELSA